MSKSKPTDISDIKKMKKKLKKDGVNKQKKKPAEISSVQSGESKVEKVTKIKKLKSSSTETIEILKSSSIETTVPDPKTKEAEHTSEPKITMGSTEQDIGRKYTVSVALPVSIIANAQSFELRAYLVGQIARALTIFGIDEVVVYEDQSSLAKCDDGSGVSQALAFFVRNLQYLETPQYLRRQLFTLHKDLKYTGLQNPLDAPHHMRMDEWSPYREGVVNSHDKEGGCWANCGIQNDMWIEQTIEKGLRVTVKVDRESWDSGDAVIGKAVSPSEPREAKGLYWGYQTRAAGSLRAALEECPFDGGYDQMVGTSERGDVVDHSYELPKFKHLLIVFGGLGGLEEVLEDDMCQMTERDPSKLFKTYINACVEQSSRTIRTEEALLVTMSLLRPILQRNIPPGNI